MPQHTKELSLDHARRIVGERCFARTTTDRVGVELEWFTSPSNDPPDIATLTKLLAGCELDSSALTFEPGGQVELSSAPFPTCSEACDAVARDSDRARATLAQHGIGLFAAGSDPVRPRRLLTDAPRYVAMRAYFDRYGAAGADMMCGSAAIHINLDAGDDEEGRKRWDAANAIGPMLVAAFANSPLLGAKSSRVQAWRQLDPSRTSAVSGEGGAGGAGGPKEAWASYALDAQVMFIRGGDAYHVLDDAMTFAEWIDGGHERGYPDEDDLLYHLTTLFPPVRPHGWLELRMVDMLPDPWWRAAVEIATALVCDPAARSVALEVCRPIRTMWEEAARCGLEDPLLAEAAKTSFEAALHASPSPAVHAYNERFTSCGRTPADDQLAEVT